MKKHFLSILILGVAASLAGCTLPSTPPCAPGDLVAPALGSPAMWAVVSSLTPTLSWSSTSVTTPYPYDDCRPSGYHVNLRMGPSSAFDIGGDTYGPGMREWTPSVPLLPGTEYHWSVRAYVPTGNGPYADERVFFTGPMCATSALVAPILLQPMNGVLVSTLQPMLIWEYPEDCIPEGYRIDLSIDPTFGDTSLSGGTGNPSTRWLPGTDLANCTWYYWRVAAINGTTLGPFSITRNFMVNTGSCLYPVPEVLIPIEPLITIAPVFTATPVPAFTLSKNANCRIGPSQLFEVYTSFLAGEVLPIQGRNEDASWLYAHTPDNGFCWVSVVTGLYNGDPNLLPFVDSPPPPEPAEEQPQYNSCQDYTTQALCKQDPANIGGCYWSPNNFCDRLQ